MVLLPVLIGQETQFDNTPFFTIYKFTLVLLIYVSGNLAFICLDTHVRNRETPHSVNKIDDNGEPSKECDFLSGAKTVFNRGRLPRDNLVQEVCQCASIYHTILVNVSLEEIVLHECGKVSTGK